MNIGTSTATVEPTASFTPTIQILKYDALLSTLFKDSEFPLPKNDLVVPAMFFCLYGVKLHLLRTSSHPYETKKENAPVSTLENVNNVLSPMTHSLLHKSRVPKHTNSTIITSFVNRYTSLGFNYQTQHVTQTVSSPTYTVLDTTYLILPPDQNAKVSVLTNRTPA